MANGKGGGGGGGKSNPYGCMFFLAFLITNFIRIKF
jgi:hypothetical protein